MEQGIGVLYLINALLLLILTATVALASYVLLFNEIIQQG